MTQQTQNREWRERAACRDVDPELFFPAAESGPVRDAQVTAAKTVCGSCPVRAECLVEALARIPYGIAGGLTEHERARLRRRAAVTTTDHNVAAAVEDVLTGGPPPGMTAQERVQVGRALLAAGRSARQVATDCGVSRRSVERWAADATPTSAGVGERSRGGHRAPLQVSQHSNSQAGTRAPEGDRA